MKFDSNLGFFNHSIRSDFNSFLNHLRNEIKFYLAFKIDSNNSQQLNGRYLISKMIA
jgi:hypothetical protein